MATTRSPSSEGSIGAQPPRDDEAAWPAGLSRRDFGRMLAVAAGTTAALGAPAVARSDNKERPAGPSAAAFAAATRDDAFFARVRRQFSMPPSVAPLNAANLCPTPRPVQQAMVHPSDLDHDVAPHNRHRLQAAREQTRAKLARFLGVGVGELLLLRNTSEGNCLVSSGLALGPGDEVVIFADNHPSHGRAWHEKARRFGFVVREVTQVNPHPGADYYIETFTRAMTAKTRVLALTDVTNTTGDVLPVRALGRIARERGILTAVDGAQSFGRGVLELGELGVDFYSGSGHKWLCGPRETGFLYVRSEVQPRLWPTVISLYEGQTELARRHEGLGQRDEDALVALGVALDFQEQIGRGAIAARAEQLRQQFIQGVKRLDGVTLWTHPDSTRSQAVVSLRPGTLDTERLRSALAEKHGLLCATRDGADRGGLRIAPHFYNNPAEIDRLLAALRGYLRSGI